jgi:hypothetical protein
MRHLTMPENIIPFQNIELATSVKKFESIEKCRNTLWDQYPLA